MSRLKTPYLNWKVLVALVLIGTSIWLVTTNAMTLLLPVLFVAIFPFSLLAFFVVATRNRQKKPQLPRIEGHLLEEQIASLTAQLLIDYGYNEVHEKDDTASHDQWMKL